MKTRFETFLFLYQTAVILNAGNGKTDKDAALSSLAAVYDPNVQTKIDQGTDEPVIKKVLAYANYVFHKGPKPFWFVLASDEGPSV